MNTSLSANPRQWLTEYLRTRENLGSRDSDFRCDPACLRPGCKNPDLQVPVSIVDLLGVASHLNTTVSEIFHRCYVLGLFSDDREDWITTVAVRLQKPCPFLEQDLCRIYPVRPLPCMLFPEYLVSRGTFASYAAKTQFRDYLCVHRPLRLSPQRTRAVAGLRDLWEREMLVSSYYLFDHGPCYIDFGNLAAALVAGDSGTIDLEAKQPELPKRLTHQDLERFFREALAAFPPFAGAAERIGHLDDRERQAGFLQLLQDDRLVKKLRQAGDDRALVYQFQKGKLQARRRGIVPTEYKFY